MDNLPLILSILAGVLVVWWVIKKAVKLALYAGVAAVGFYLWSQYGG
jgi:hypothetical protein